MSKEIINIGSDPGNQGDGDTLRDAFRKAQSNFDELYTFGPITDTSLDHSDSSVDGTIAQALLECANNGGGTVLIGPGDFLLSTNTLILEANCRLIGSGKGATLLRTAHSNNAITAGFAGLGQLAKWEVANLEIYLNSGNSQSAIRTSAAQCLIGTVREVMLTGGASDSWGITMDAMNVATISRVTYRGEGSGIRWINDNRYAVNYGDSAIENTDIYLNNTNVTGIQIASPVYPSNIPTTLRMNNVLLSRVEIIAKNGVLNSGTVGIHLRNAARITFINVDIEKMDTGLLQESAVNGGPIATSNAFFQTYTLGCNNDYVESGTTPAQQTIIGGHGDFTDLQQLPSSNILCYDSNVGYNRALTAARPIVMHSDSINPLALSVEDAGKVFTNKDATGTVTFELPDLNLNISLEFEFHLASPGYSIRILPGASSLIRPAQTVTGTYYESDTSWGQVLRIRNIDGSVWSIIDEQGSWT